MKNLVRVLFIALVSLLFVSMAYADNHQSQQQTNTEQKSKIHRGKERYQLVRLVGTASEYTHAPILMAGKVDIHEKTPNSEIILGGTVHLGGAVAKNTIIAAGDLNLATSIGEHALLFGGNINIAKQSTIGGRVIIFGGNVKLNGIYQGDVTIFAGKATIAGTINGDVQVFAGHVIVLPGAHIKGDLTYGSPTELVIDQGAKIDGGVGQWKAKPTTQKTIVTPVYWTSHLPSLVLYFGLLVIGIVLILICPGFNRSVYRKLALRPWSSIGVGLVTLFIIPIVAFLLLFTIIGIPLALVLMLIYIAMLILAYVVACMGFGTLIMRIFGKKTENIGRWGLFFGLLIGLIIIYLLRGIPFLGWWVGLIVLLFGLGMLVMSMYVHDKPKVVNE